MNILESYTQGLVEKDGIYFSKKESSISYPQEGNENCFQIEKDSFWFNHRNNCITEAVKMFAVKDLFFDIGGGNGFVAKGLEDEGISTVLIEPGIQGCLNAKERGLPNIVCSTLENASFIKNSIHAIGLFDVVEHINNDLDFLKSTGSYLKREGLVFITVPAYNFLWSNDDVDAGHFKRYTVKSLETLLRQAGFEIEFSTYIFSILPIPVFFSRTLPSKLSLNKKPKDVKEHINDHKPKKGIVDNLLKNVWAHELKQIKKKKKIPFGGSCFVVARKK